MSPEYEINWGRMMNDHWNLVVTDGTATNAAAASDKLFLITMINTEVYMKGNTINIFQPHGEFINTLW